MTERGLSGRQAQARRNDAAILTAARAVFIANPDAPIAAVAEHAEVNISSLYRRFASKEDLVRQICGDGLQTYIDIARAAVDDEEGDPWEVFATFMRRIVEADTHALTIKLAGRFQPTEHEWRNSVEAERLYMQLVARTKAAGVLRADLDPEDLSFIFEQLSNVKGATPRRTAQLRARYLALHLDALRAPGRIPLPGPPPTAREQHARWQPPTAPGPHQRRTQRRS
jgi:AcrR family transcriptional regulator